MYGGGKDFPCPKEFAVLKEMGYLVSRKKEKKKFIKL